MFNPSILILLASAGLIEGSVLDARHHHLHRRAAANGGDASATTLAANAIQSGSFVDGSKQIGANENNQAKSQTSTNNFINNCAGKTLTNGLQITTGSCNGIPMGDIPAKTNMVSSIITNPVAGSSNIQSDTTFNITVQMSNLVAGSFTNADATYFAAPQFLSGGQVVGHTHVTVQDMGSSLNPTVALNPTQFAFFKGINDPGNGKGLLTATVTGGLPAGNYRVCTMASASNHQPVIMPVAQRGTADDCTKFTVVGSGTTENAAANDGEKGIAAAAAAASAVAAGPGAIQSSASSVSSSSTSVANNGNGGKGNNKGTTTSVSTTTSVAGNGKGGKGTTTSSLSTTSAAGNGKGGKGTTTSSLSTASAAGNGKGGKDTTTSSATASAAGNGNGGKGTTTSSSSTTSAAGKGNNGGKGGNKGTTTSSSVASTSVATTANGKGNVVSSATLASASAIQTTVVQKVVVIETFFEFQLSLGGLPPSVGKQGESFVVLEEVFEDIISAAGAACSKQYETCIGFEGPGFSIEECSIQKESCGSAASSQTSAAAPTTVTATATVPPTASVTGTVIAESTVTTSFAASATSQAAVVSGASGAKAVKPIVQKSASTCALVTSTVWVDPTATQAGDAVKSTSVGCAGAKKH